MSHCRAQVQYLRIMSYLSERAESPGTKTNSTTSKTCSTEFWRRGAVWVPVCLCTCLSEYLSVTVPFCLSCQIFFAPLIIYLFVFPFTCVLPVSRSLSLTCLSLQLSSVDGSDVFSSYFSNVKAVLQQQVNSQTLIPYRHVDFSHVMIVNKGHK